MAEENDRVRKMLDDMLAALDRDSVSRAQQEGASQVEVAKALDRKIIGDEEADADSLYAEQYRRQLPSERQAMAMGTSNGNSADELKNYAMIMRGRREGQRAGIAPAESNGVRQVPRDDSAGFEKDFGSDQKMRQRMTDMFGSGERVPETEKQRLLAEMAKGAQASVAAMSGPPATAGAMDRPPSAPLPNIPLPAYPGSPSYPSPTQPDRPSLDMAAERERLGR